MPAGRSAATVAASSRRCCSAVATAAWASLRAAAAASARRANGRPGAGDLGPPFRPGRVGTLEIVAEGRQAEHRLLVSCRQLDAAPVGALEARVTSPNCSRASRVTDRAD